MTLIRWNLNFFTFKILERKNIVTLHVSMDSIRSMLSSVLLSVPVGVSCIILQLNSLICVWIHVLFSIILLKFSVIKRKNSRRRCRRLIRWHKWDYLVFDVVTNKHFKILAENHENKYIKIKSNWKWKLKFDRIQALPIYLFGEKRF